MVDEHSIYKFEDMIVYVFATGVSRKGSPVVFYRNILNPTLRGTVIQQEEFLKTAKVIGIKEVTLMLKVI